MVGVMKHLLSNIAQRIPFLLLLIIIGPLYAAPPSNDSELMKQLEALQQELRSLKSEIKSDIEEIRNTVTKMRRATAPDVAPVASLVTTVRIGDAPVLGSRDAKVGIVEFTDYECPFCKRHHEQTFPALKATYIDTGKIKYVVRDFPLGFHPQAKGAAIAAHCAGEQGKYWEMQDRIFLHQSRLGLALYEEQAKALALKYPEFMTCLKDAKWDKRVDEDQTEGETLGIRGTPNFFIGRIQGDQLVEARQIVGAQPFSVFAQTLDPLLK